MILTLFEQAFRLQQRDANTKESKDMVLESDDFLLHRSPLLFDNNLNNNIVMIVQSLL